MMLCRVAPKKTGIRPGATVYLDQHGMPWSEAERADYRRQPPLERLLLGMIFDGPFRYGGRAWWAPWRARVEAMR